MKNIDDKIMVEAKQYNEKEINKLYIHWQPYINTLVRYFYKAGALYSNDIDIAEAYSIGYIGFREAITKYNPERGKFKNCLFTYVRRYIFLEAKKKLIRVHAKQKTVRSNYTQAMWEKSMNQSYYVLSLDKPLNIDNADNTLHSKVGFDYMKADYNIIKNDVMDKYKIFKELYSDVKQERIDMFNDYFINELSLRDIARLYNKTFERVRQIIVEVCYTWKIFYDTGIFETRRFKHIENKNLRYYGI